MKGPGRIIDKLDDDREIKDSLRSTLLTPHPLDDIESIIIELESQGYHVIPEDSAPFEDRISPGSRKSSGYGDVVLKLSTGSGDEVIKELLVMPDWMPKAKKIETELYTQRRELERQGRFEAAAVLEARGAAIYSDAEQEALRAGWTLRR